MPQGSRDTIRVPRGCPALSSDLLIPSPRAAAVNSLAFNSPPGRGELRCGRTGGVSAGFASASRTRRSVRRRHMRMHGPGWSRHRLARANKSAVSAGRPAGVRMEPRAAHTNQRCSSLQGGTRCDGQPLKMQRGGVAGTDSIPPIVAAAGYGTDKDPWFRACPECRREFSAQQPVAAGGLAYARGGGGWQQRSRHQANSRRHQTNSRGQLRRRVLRLDRRADL